ncbi:MAG: hypothetical protein EOO07_08635 [Chitinophagaceae bacterium]|nr:MAG: hypothetical protein EOO07_08635 [Chitinophagaceae bacterium]
MGITSSVISALTPLCKPKHSILDETNSIIQCSPTLAIHTVSLSTTSHPQEFIHLQETYQKEGTLLVHLWEDVWLRHPEQVLSRVKSFLRLNKTYHARKTHLTAVDAAQAKQFFTTNHLQGFVKAKHHYGLTIEGDTIAMASFSDLRPMKSKGTDYTSAELVRFASKEGCTVTGGLSKLIKHFLTLKQPNDLMSYADRDWSLGKGYEQLGFKLTALTDPAYLYVDSITKQRYFRHRLPKKVLYALDRQKELNLDDYLAEQGFLKAFNTGNLKYHLYV